jgi:hypothetical protein
MKISGEAEGDRHREGPPEGFEDLTDEEKKELKEDFGEDIRDKFKRTKKTKEDGGLFGWFGKKDKKEFKEGNFDDRREDFDFNEEGLRRDNFQGGIGDKMSPEEYKKFKALPEKERRK